MRYNGPRNRIARRENMDLGLKTPGSKSHASLLKKINVMPGQHGTQNRRKKSEYNRQLREKQKLRYSFGVTETVMKKYFGNASKKRGNTAVSLSEILERRIDNVVYRLGFAPTRPAARQLVSHGHIAVNGKKVSTASYQVSNDSVVTFAKEESKKIPYIDVYRTQSDLILPAWLELKKDEGKLLTTPDSSLIEKQVNLRLVVEFYSR
jgi:small subunit ribosomal protein S4